LRYIAAAKNRELKYMNADQRRLEFPPTCRPETVSLYEYWLRKCGDRIMPRRADVDPAEIPPRLLPCISLVDVVPDERRYVYRLVGTADAQVRGHDPTGKSVAEGFFGPSVEDALGCYDRVVATKAPVLDPIPFTATNGRYSTEETMFLPLSDDGVNVNKIIVFSAYVDVLDPGSVVQLDL
jgi:hypothetical protein